MPGLRYQVTNPAAGANFTFTAPTDMEVTSVRFDLNNGSTVADRLARLFSNVSGFFVWVASAVVPASQTRFYYLMQGNQAQRLDPTNANNILEWFPRLVLRRGDTLESIVQNLQAGDTITNIWIFGEKI